MSLEQNDNNVNHLIEPDLLRTILKRMTVPGFPTSKPFASKSLKVKEGRALPAFDKFDEVGVIKDTTAASLSPEIFSAGYRLTVD